MQEIRVILLAAGFGTRLQKILKGKPKPLIDYGGEPLIHRTIRQLDEMGFANVSVVVGYKEDEVTASIMSYFPSTRIVRNPLFAEDRNIYSLLCGLEKSVAPALIIEGDVAFADKSILDLRKGIEQGKSYWTGCGFFKDYQAGAIIKADKNNNIQEILYTSFDDRYQNYYKNLGALFCGAEEMPRFMELLEEYASRTLDEYFITPWAEHLVELPAKLIDLGENGGVSFNTDKEYEVALNLVPPIGHASLPGKKIELIKTSQLRHIENFDHKRAVWLADKIHGDGVWTMPIVVDSDYFLVMDGQHRMEAAAILGLRYVPVIKFRYTEVDVWSLRPETETVTVNDIIQRGLRGDIYPYKTAKHQFPEQIPMCSFALKDLE